MSTSAPPLSLLLGGCPILFLQLYWFLFVQISSSLPLLSSPPLSPPSLLLSPPSFPPSLFPSLPSHSCLFHFLSHSPLQISILFPEHISCSAMYANNMCPSHSLTKACASFPFVALSTLYIEISSHICQMNQSYNWEISFVSRTMHLTYTLLLKFLSQHFLTSLWGGGTMFCTERPPGTVY